MAFTLPALPYAKNALAPHISEETVSFHYEKHHAGYVTKLNQLTEGSPLASKSLDEVVKTEKGKIFNMAAQVRANGRLRTWWSGLVEAFAQTQVQFLAALLPAK